MDRINQMLDRLSELSDDEISELNGLIITEFEALENQETPTAETVDTMTALADSLDKVRIEDDRRTQEREALASRAAEAAARVHGSGETAEGADTDQTAESAEEPAQAEASAEAGLSAETETPEAAAAPETPAPAETVLSDGSDVTPPANSPAEDQPSDAPAEAPVPEPVSVPADNPDADAPADPGTVPAQQDAPEPTADHQEAAAAENDSTLAAESEQEAPEQETPAPEAEVAAPEQALSNTEPTNTEENQEAPVTASADGQEVQVQPPEDALPVPRQSAAVAITAGADIPGMALGSKLDNAEDIARAMSERLRAIRNATGGDGEQSIVASIQLDYPEERVLSANNGMENWDKIEAVVSSEAITAAGGFCAPLEVRYDLFGLGSTERPVRDALPAFRADRGGIRYVDPPVLSSFGTATGLWTAATDASPGTATKPCLTVTCGNESTAVVDAITLCLQFGNLMTRAFPELVQRNNELAAIQFARYAELRLLAKIKTAGTNLTEPKELGAVRDLLDSINRAAASLRYRHRISPNSPLRFVAPAWVKNMLRSDLSKQMPGDSVGDQHALADSRINSWFAARNINATWTLEGLPTFGGPGQGTTTVLADFPTTIEWDLFPEGTFLLLDGGTLDLGIIRDSTLVGTNDYRMFMEGFEGVAKLGPESLHVTQTISATGEAEALVDTVS